MPGGPGGYNPLGTNFARKKGSIDTFYNSALGISSDLFPFTPGSDKVIDYIEILCTAGAIEVWLEDASGNKKIFKVPATAGMGVLYPGRFCLDIDLVTIEVKSVTVGADGGQGEIIIAFGGQTNNAPNI